MIGSYSVPTIKPHVFKIDSPAVLGIVEDREVQLAAVASVPLFRVLQVALFLLSMVTKLELFTAVLESAN